MESLGKRLTRDEAGDTVRFRREMQDSEVGVYRRVEEVTTWGWGGMILTTQVSTGWE